MFTLLDVTDRFRRAHPNFSSVRHGILHDSVLRIYFRPLGLVQTKILLVSSLSVVIRCKAPTSYSNQVALIIYSECVKYLDVTFDSSLSFKDHPNNVIRSLMYFLQNLNYIHCSLFSDHF